MLRGFDISGSPNKKQLESDYRRIAEYLQIEICN